MRRLFVILTVLLASMLLATPALAYSGADVTVIDSVNLESWVHGGDVFLVSDLDGIVGAEILTAGQASIPHGGGSLCAAVGGCNAVSNGATVEIVIDFKCQTSTNPCNPPEGYPDTSAGTTYVQNALPFQVSRTVRTGTGPNAVSMAGFGGFSSLWAVAALVAGVGGLALLYRRRKV